MSINVYLADDHTLFRKGFIRLLQSFKRIGEIQEAANGKELIELVQKKLPDVVLLDIRMPVMDGIETCDFLHHQFPDLLIMMLTMEDDENYVDLLLNKGARGYLLKSASTEEVETAIYTLYDHHFYSNDLMAKSLRVSKKIELEDEIFTNREFEILRLTYFQKSMKEIALHLGISERTVQTHRRNMMLKIGVHNSTGLVKYAVDRELFKE
jgi:DNA-binding NarL/FixJ family response regulator